MRKLFVAICLLLAAVVAQAELLGSPGLSATQTSATATLARSAKGLTFFNDKASANEVYIRVFKTGETTGAATTSSPLRLEPGEAASLPSADSQLWSAFSYVCATGETATLRYLAE